MGQTPRQPPPRRCLRWPSRRFGMGVERPPAAGHARRAGREVPKESAAPPGREMRRGRAWGSLVVMGDPLSCRQDARSRSQRCVLPMTPIRAAVQCGGCGASFPTLAASPVSARRFLADAAFRHGRGDASLASAVASRHGWAASMRRETPRSPAPPPERGRAVSRLAVHLGQAPIGTRCGPPCLAGRLPGHRHYSGAALLRLPAPTSASADNAAFAASGCREQ